MWRRTCGVCRTLNAARALKADLREQLATGSVSDTSDATAQSLGGEQDGRGGMRWGEMRWGGMDWRVAKPQPVFGAAPCHCRLARRRLDRGALPPPVCMLEEGTQRADHERDSLGEAVAHTTPRRITNPHPRHRRQHGRRPEQAAIYAGTSPSSNQHPSRRKSHALRSVQPIAQHQRKSQCTPHTHNTKKGCAPRAHASPVSRFADECLLPFVSPITLAPPASCASARFAFLAK